LVKTEIRQNIYNKKADVIKKTKGLLVCKKNIVSNLIVKKGDTLSQQFKFINKGIEDVEILEYNPSCNCTEIKLSKTVVKPEDSVFVVMKVDTKDKLIGSDKVNTTLTTNGERKFYFLSVKFEIVY
jgi:hypothetical protein